MSEAGGWSEGVDTSVRERAVARPSMQTDDTDVQDKLAKMGISPKTLEKMKADSEKQRKEMTKKLTAVKKQWRKEEAKEQEKLDREREQQLAQGKKGVKREIVKKKELPWWLSDTYQVPSNSEDEADFERKENETKGKANYAPNGPEMFKQWLSVMESMNLNGDSDDDIDPADLSDDDLALAKEASASPYVTKDSFTEDVHTTINQLVGNPQHPVPAENVKGLFLDEINLANNASEKHHLKTTTNDEGNAMGLEGSRTKEDGM